MTDVQSIGPQGVKYPNIKGEVAGGHNFGVERAYLMMSKPCLFQTSYNIILIEFRLTADLADVHCNSRQSEELIVNGAMGY